MITDKTFEPLEIVLSLIQASLIHLRDVLTDEQKEIFTKKLDETKKKIIAKHDIKDEQIQQLILKFLP